MIAIIGPQSSSVAHMMSQIANGLEVPLVSYAATDPTLSSLQYPFFLRSTQSDYYQMAAMADLIDFHGWKEVNAIFVDDDYGRNGIFALSNELEKKRAKISNKLFLPVNYSLQDITKVLQLSKHLGPRVYVVHVGPDPQLRIFDVAQKLEMMTKDYVWFATDWLSATIDSITPMNVTSLHMLQGVVTLSQHTPDSSKRTAFLSRWKKLQQRGLVSSGIHIYAFQAYDTVWAVANSISDFIRGGNNITFSYNKKLLDMSETHIGKLKLFNGGTILLQKLLDTNFTGLAGQVQFDEDRNVISNGYDVININGTAIHRVGYWSNHSGFSVLPPENLKRDQDQGRISLLDQKLGDFIWPGGKMERPRGWVVADGERPLRIGVPRRTSFTSFVSEAENSHEFKGYCVDVFKEARELIPYDVPYKFVPFGDGHSNPNYDELVKMVANGVSSMDCF